MQTVNIDEAKTHLFCHGSKFTADYPDQIDDMPAEERGSL